MHWSGQRSQHCVRVSSSVAQCYTFRKGMHHDSKRRFYFLLSFLALCNNVCMTKTSPCALRCTKNSHILPRMSASSPFGPSPVPVLENNLWYWWNGFFCGHSPITASLLTEGSLFPLCLLSETCTGYSNNQFDVYYAVNMASHCESSHLMNAD